MNEVLTFAFLREGTSDDGLLPHLRELIVRAGASATIGSSRDYRGSMEDRLRQVLDEGTNVDLVFVHRDADGSSPSPRRDEVRRAAQAVGLTAVVSVVPVQELEAWLLVDEAAIRGVVGKPSGRDQLSLPTIRAIEQTASPKEILKRACLTASETTGRRREREKREFPQRRRNLLERLDIDGPVRSLPSWRQLEDDIDSAVIEVLSR
ncbi:MAG: hypothetical protein ACTHQ3_18975 [Motilibacteraceae bacterium]